MKNFDKFKKIFIQNTLEFCQNTTIHGLKYVGNRSLHVIQRFFFAISLIAVIFLVSFYISKSYRKWTENPIIFGINPQPTFVTDEPFPAVTICNMNPVMKSRLVQALNDSMDHPELELICNFWQKNQKSLKMFEERDLMEFLVKVSQPCENMITYCRFGVDIYNCSEVFNLIVTSQGVCCVFNMLHPKFMYISRVPYTLQNFKVGNFTPVDWSAQKGYPDELPSKFIPRSVLGTGESLGLTLMLDLEGDDFYCSSTHSNGFKILIHNPTETPNVQEMGLLLSPGRKTQIRVTPEKLETETKLRSVSRNYRYCLFPDEIKLRYFSHYTQRNCETECIARAMYRHSGCIIFYLPLIYASSRICSASSALCAQQVLWRSDISVEYCLNSCLPSCSDLTFFGYTTSAFLNSNDPIFLLRNYTQSYIKENVAIVNMFFKEFIFRSLIQQEFVGTADFISNVGGLMGLFLGFSLISVLELFYFAFMRPLQNVLTVNKNDINNHKECTNACKIKLKTLRSKRFQLKKHLWLEFARLNFRKKSRNFSKTSSTSEYEKTLRDILESMK